VSEPTRTGRQRQAPPKPHARGQPMLRRLRDSATAGALRRLGVGRFAMGFALCLAAQKGTPVVQTGVPDDLGCAASHEHPTRGIRPATASRTADGGVPPDGRTEGRSP